MRWRMSLGWSRGVRMRTALSATLVVAVALALAAGTLVVLQRRQLVQGLTSVAEQQAAEIGAQVSEEGVRSADLPDLSRSAGEQSILQVLAPDGSVAAASAAVRGEAPLSKAAPTAGQVLVETVDRLPIGEHEPYVVVVTGVQTPQGVARVIAAQGLEGVQRSTSVVLTLLGLGYPVLLLVVAGTSWWLAGRALAPVEAIRRRVGQVSSTDLGARVPVPASDDEIARLARTMNSMLARLQESAASQRRFVADASHELRSPLTTIRAAAEVAGTHPEALDWPSASLSILEETDRLDRLVSDLLLLARSDEHGLVMRQEDVDVDDLVTEEAARLRRRGTHVRLDVRSARVRGDVEHLVRALRNLTDNAARYARTTLELRVRAADGLAHVEVVDDGPGIPEAHRNRVFERFVRLDDSRERGSGGTGLGLAITRQIARAHGGDVVIEPPVTGAGTRVVLSLPLPPAPEPEPVAPADPRGAAQPPSAARR